MDPHDYSADGDASLIDSANRREHDRAAIDALVECVEIDAEGAACREFKGHAGDISRSGMCVVAPSMVHTGRWLVVFIPRRNDKPKMLVGRVRQSRYEPSKGYMVGLQFCPQPKTPAFRAFLRSRQSA